jgi:outer membrane cobalamin receptor
MRCVVLCALLLLCLLVAIPGVGHAQAPPAGTPEAAPAAPEASPLPPEAIAGEETATDEQGAAEAPEATAGEEPATQERAAEGAVPEIEVEVTATHEWPAKVETLTAEQVGRMVSAPFIGDVLERVPGTDTLHGCLNGAQLLTIRGNNSEWSELVLDGMPLSPIGRPYILSYVPMSAIDAVRILKGPVPPRYPGMTIAGLILLDMKTGDRYPGTQVSTKTGGYGQHILDLSIGGGQEDRNYFLSFERNQTDGWMPHSDMSFNFVSGKFVVAPDARSKLTLVAADIFGNKNGPRPLGPNPKDKWAAEWTDVAQPKASLTYERQLSDRQDITLRFVPTRFTGTQTWNQWFTDHVEQRFMPWEYGLLRGEFEHDIRVAPERIWSWGASWQQDRYSFTDPLKLTFWDNIPEDKRHSYSKHGRSLYAQYTQPAGAAGTLTLGGRYDSENPGQSIASPFVSWFKHLNSSTGLRLAFTRSRRFPTLSELYGQGVWTGNPALQPEMGWTYQADLTRSLRNGTIDLSLYDSQLENLVVADEHNVYSNLGKARLRGAELGWQGTWHKAVFWCNYTFLDGENALTGDPLIAAFRTAFPKHSAKAGVSVRDNYGGEHTVEVLAYGRRRTDVDEPTFVGDPWNVTVPPSLPGFMCVNYQYAWPLSSHGRFTVAAENLLNVEAQDLLFYPRPGRWVSGNLSWSF